MPDPTEPTETAPVTGGDVVNVHHVVGTSDSPEWTPDPQTFPTSIDAKSGSVEIGAPVDGTVTIKIDHPVFEGEKQVVVRAGDQHVGTWHFSGKDTPKTVTVEADGEVTVRVTSGDTVIAEK